MAYIDSANIKGTLYELQDTQARTDVSDLRSALAGPLLALLRNVVYTNDQGQSYYDALYSALNTNDYPRIVAVFTPGTHSVYEGDNLDTLKPYLVVTYYEDGDSTGTVVSNYTLIGELVEGTQTIIVSYQSCRADFNVTVTNPFIYRLPNTPVTFNGTNYINSEVALLNEDRSFTIAFDFIDNKNYYSATMTNGCIFGCRMSESPYNGMMWNFYDAGAPTTGQRKVRMNFGGKPTGSYNFEQIYASSDAMIGRRARGIIRYNSSNHTIKAQLSVNGTELQPYVTPVSSCDLGAGTITNPLTIGTRMPITGTEYIIGIMNDFKVFDSALSDAEMQSYIEGVA